MFMSGARLSSSTLPLVLLLANICVPAALAVTVDAPVGKVVGTTAGKVDRFLGIRYGVAERFEASRPFNYSAGKPIDASEYGAWCYQASFPEKPDPSHTYSEDCLFLNVWREAAGDKSKNETKQAAQLAPVMFYIHGGTRVVGSKAGPGASAAACCNHLCRQ